VSSLNTTRQNQSKCEEIEWLNNYNLNELVGQFIAKDSPQAKKSELKGRN